MLSDRATYHSPLETQTRNLLQTTLDLPLPPAEASSSNIGRDETLTILSLLLLEGLEGLTMMVIYGTSLTNSGGTHLDRLGKDLMRRGPLIRWLLAVDKSRRGPFLEFAASRGHRLNIDLLLVIGAHGLWISSSHQRPHSIWLGRIPSSSSSSPSGPLCSRSFLQYPTSASNATTPRNSLMIPS